MKDLKEQLRSRLSQKKLNQSSIGAIALSILNKEFNVNDKLNAYIRHSIIFVKTIDGFDKTQIYLKKKVLIDKINAKLKQIGYKKTISNIIIK